MQLIPTLLVEASRVGGRVTLKRGGARLNMRAHIFWARQTPEWPHREQNDTMCIEHALVMHAHLPGSDMHSLVYRQPKRRAT